MKAILDSEVKDDTFIGTTCEVSISSGPQSTVVGSYSIFSSILSLKLVSKDMKLV